MIKKNSNTHRSRTISKHEIKTKKKKNSDYYKFLLLKYMTY